MPQSAAAPPGSARDRLLAAAVDVIRTKGLHATSVEDLCEAAGASKGAFFHHFPSKDALAVAAAAHWSASTGGMFAAAAYHRLADPVARVHGYLDLRAQLVRGPTEAFTCLVGTMAQEAFATHPDVRDACAASILGHAATLEADLREALELHAPHLTDEAPSLACHTQVVLQGAFVVAKAADDPTIVLESIEHLRRYLDHLFSSAPAGAGG